MSFKNWKESIELVGLVAVLAGLYLVYSEIQQNSLIARAELNMIIYQDVLVIRERLSEPDFAKTYLKALNTPQLLTAEERLQVNSILASVTTIFRRERQLYNLGVFNEYENMPRALSRLFLTNEYGRAFWAVERETMPEALRVVVDEVLAQDADGNNFQRFDEKLVEQLNSKSSGPDDR